MRKIKFTMSVFVLIYFYTAFLFSDVRLTAASNFTNDNVFKPVKIVMSEDRIYLFDSADQSLKIVSKDNKIIKTIGRKGEGPGEVRNSTDFTVTGEKIFLLDVNKIEIFSKKSGNHLASKRIIETVRPIKLSLNGDTFYLTSMEFQKGGKLIKKYNEKNKTELKLSQSFLECTPVDGKSLTNFYKNFGSLAFRDGKVYFAYLVFNKVLEFSRDGQLLNELTVPFQPIDLENLKMKMTGSQLRLSFDKGVNVELRQKGKDLYLLSCDENSESVIYKLENGAFKEKYRMKEQIASFDISGSEIWAIGMIDDEINILVYKTQGKSKQQEKV